MQKRRALADQLKTLQGERAVADAKLQAALEKVHEHKDALLRVSLTMRTTYVTMRTIHVTMRTTNVHLPLKSWLHFGPRDPKLLPSGAAQSCKVELLHCLFMTCKSCACPAHHLPTGPVAIHTLSSALGDPGLGQSLLEDTLCTLDTSSATELLIDHSPAAAERLMCPPHCLCPPLQVPPLTGATFHVK